MSESEIEVPLVETPVVETPEPKTAPEPKAEPEKPAEPISLRDQIKSAITKVNAAQAEKEKPEAQAQPTGERVRDPATGQFVAKDIKAAPKERVEQPKQVDVKPLEAAKPGADPKTQDAAPGTWKAGAKAKWNALDPEVKSEVLRRESESAREVGKYQQQIQQINQSYGPIEQLIGPRRHAWRAQFGSEQEALKRLFNLSDFASQDPNGFLSYFISQPDVASRVDLQKVFGGQPQGGEQPQLNHPMFQAVQQKLTGLEQQFSTFLNQHQTAQQTSTEQQIADFVSAKGQDGALLRPHFDAVREDVFNLIPALKAQFPGHNAAQILEKAYQIAIHTNATVSGEISRLDEQRIREEIERKQRLEKAQLASKSIPTGRPANEAGALSEDPTDLRKTLQRNFKKFSNGEAARI